MVILWGCSIQDMGGYVVIGHCIIASEARLVTSTVSPCRYIYIIILTCKWHSGPAGPTAKRNWLSEVVRYKIACILSLAIYFCCTLL